MRAPIETVRWGQAPFAFRLETPDPTLAARAREVFATWPAPPSASCAAAFRVDRIAHEEPRGCDAVARDDRASSASGAARWRIVAEPSGERWDRESADDALRCVEYSAVQAFVPDTSAAIAIHGALVDFGGRGALVVGPQLAGKSSLACAAWLDGAALLSDDVALVDLASAEARPGPRRVALRHASRELLGDGVWRRILAARSSVATDEGWCFHPSEVDGRPRRAKTTLAAVIFLARSARPALAPGAVARIAPAHAVLAWLPYLVAAGRLDPGDAIRRVAPLAARVAAWDLERGPLPLMVARVRKAIAGNA
ncbi:MAG TPA: hypothetical protein VFD92_05025 [Candidatus Binatia bacterium]|nr:hypothetical protein [Candidatus Binatia bacterium]